MSADVTFTHPTLAEMLPMYRLIADAIAGSKRIKDAQELYLPNPEPTQQDAGRCDINDRKKRYNDYLKRATYYNVTRRTLNGMLGEVFTIAPVIEVPDVLEPMVIDATGQNTSLTQIAVKAVSQTTAFSRAGLFVDFSATGEDGATIAQLKSGEIRPTMWVYESWNIRNWNTKTIGTEDVLCLVVLQETYQYDKNIFGFKTAVQFRVLYLDDNNEYVQDIWREIRPTEIGNNRSLFATDKKKSKWELAAKTIKPTDSEGKAFNRIPFFVIGSEDNDIEPDEPLFYDIADLNISHYRNSADYEQSCFIHGQATPIVTGLTNDWYENVLKKRLNFGSYGGIPLPVGATAELLQAAPNGMIKEIMETKERQMVALGAKLVEQRNVQRTATEAKQDSATEQSVLSSIVNNVAAAFIEGLKIAARFTGADESKIKFELNKDFSVNLLGPEERKQAVEEWQKGAIGWVEMRGVLKKAGVATEDDAEVKDQIAKDAAAAMGKESSVKDANNAFTK